MALQITGRKLFVKALLAEGVDTVFAYPGGMITDILDELYKTSKIRVVLARHEQALVHEAEGYAKATGKPGICLVTSGPGATNTITGIADAHYDSVPLIIFTGQVSQPLIGNDAFQEVDIVGMTRGIVKYGYTVRDRETLGTKIKMAFYISMTGKKGPVLIDIPKDIQLKEGTPDYPSEIHLRGYKPAEGVHIGQLKKAFRMIETAKRPLILAGNGVKISGAEDELQCFAETMDIPVVTTIMGNGVIPSDSKVFVGNAGMHGRYSANMAMTHSDVLLSIGTRFNDRITGDLSEFAPDAHIIHIDIDTSSISRNVIVDIPVVADAKVALSKLNEWAEEPADKVVRDEWISKIKEWNEAHPLGMRRDHGMTPQMIMEGIDKVFPTGIVTTDVGQHQMWAEQYLPEKKDRPIFTSGGLGTMGFGFPAAIGAKLASPESDVISITGDGGFQMNMQELATAVCNHVNLTIVLLNNETLGMVHQFQDLFYGKRYEITCLKQRPECPKNCKGPSDKCPPYVPDFIKLIESYGGEGIRVFDEKDIVPALEKAKGNKDIITLIEFMIRSDELVFPMVKGGEAIDKMILK